MTKKKRTHKQSPDMSPSVRLIGAETSSGVSLEEAIRYGSMVRKSTLYFAMGLCLVVGLLLGSVLPSFIHTPISKTPAGSPPAAQQSAEQQQNIERLTPRILEVEETVRKDPNNADALVELGNLYFDVGKAPSAINAYERALALKPGNPNVLTDLGIMYREAGKFDMAVESFLKASAVDPRHQNALFNRGIVLYFDLQRKDDARTAWQKLLEVNPNAKTPQGTLVKDMLRELF